MTQVKWHHNNENRTLKIAFHRDLEYQESIFFDTRKVMLPWAPKAKAATSWDPVAHPPDTINGIPQKIQKNFENGD